ncbi:m-AAA protease-interacting protein 1, mitochondrial [Ornithorhynchus anatinus]|nr:m-AAA protease-interacting protein 1, mitochondrial [Ornithorhynchus anatinus]
MALAARLLRMRLPLAGGRSFSRPRRPVPPPARSGGGGGGGEEGRGGGEGRGEGEGRGGGGRVVALGVRSPLLWLRTRLRAALVRASCDPDFSIARFSAAATQAFAHVSKLLSQCKFDLLEELVNKEVLQVVKDKVSALPDLQKTALAAEPDQIVYSTAGDISITYDDQGRKFVNILMCFWYLTSADLPDEVPSGAKVFRIKLGDDTTKFKQLLSANYEFQREFTQGVEPDWIISRIEHSKLLE